MEFDEQVKDAAGGARGRPGAPVGEQPLSPEVVAWTARLGVAVSHHRLGHLPTVARA